MLGNGRISVKLSVEVETLRNVNLRKGNVEGLQVFLTFVAFKFF